MNTLTLDIANRLIAAAQAKGKELDLPPLGIAVLDAGGHLIALQRQDGLSFMRVQICQAKAYGALGMGVDSAALAARYEQGPSSVGFLGGVQMMFGGRLIPVAGGVLIRNAEGTVLGALGISGAKSEQDADCARVAITSVGLHHA